MIEHPTWNDELDDWEVCPTCLEIINQTFEDPVVDEEFAEEEEEEEDFP